MGRSVAARHIIVGLTFVCTCVCYIERVGFSIAYTAAADAAGISQSTKGLILSTFFYGYALSQIPGGWVAQRIGGRRVLLFSFIMWSLTTAVVPLDPGRVKAMVIARLLVGVAQGFIFPSIHNVLAQWVPPHERSRSVSLTTSGMYFGAAAGMLFLPGIVQFSGPRAVFLAEAAMGGTWALIWLMCATDPPRSDRSKALSAGFGQSTKYGNGGVLADYLITRRLVSVTNTRKWLNTGGFLVSAFALMMMPTLRTSWGAVLCSSVSLGFLALGRAGFAVNHLDVAPRYAGIVMGISNTAGTLAGIVGVGLTGQILESAKAANMDLSNPNSWTQIFCIPAFLCIFSAVIFLMFATGERIFD
ncbi:hypothetical protein SUGI_0258820 [Cryptomeria japonica]|nr:hypothetical protein SUGI_0258820 [Cryptomeria japonica]